MPINIWRRLRGFLSSGRFAFLSERRRKGAVTPVIGCPDSISFETLSEFCRNYLNEPLRKVSYIHLSGWKQTGAYRLFLETQHYQRWNLIYKNAHYSLESIPALVKLPVTPGPPEHLIYKNSVGALAKYLPRVYLVNEITPGTHYQYLLEDLNEKYYIARNARDRHAILTVVTKLSQIHTVLHEWASNVNQDQLLCYDNNFSISLREYAQKVLERYVKNTTSETGKEVCKLWDQISTIYASLEFETLPTRIPIHGDFNVSNIHISKNSLHKIKLVDWEWAGFGLAHMDLASLLKRTTPEIEKEALAVFSEREPSLSSAEHKRLYYWCQLERRLLDAAFIAVQHLESQTATRFNLEKFVETSLQQVLTTFQELAS